MRATLVWRDIGRRTSRAGGEPSGFGMPKSRIFVASLTKQFDVTPELARGHGRLRRVEGIPSVADITDESLLGKIRKYRQAMQAAPEPEG